MKFSKLVLVFVAALVIAAATGCSLFKRDGRVRADLLMVTSNTFESRLICDLAQYKSKQPIFLVSNTEDGNVEFFYVPEKDKGIIPVAYDSLGEFLEHVNARNIVIMGGARYIPQDVIDIINAQHNDVIQLTNADWEKNALTLGRMLRQNDLVRLFREYREKLMKAAK